MTVKNLKEFLADKPDNTLVGILDYFGDAEVFDVKPVFHKKVGVCGGRGIGSFVEMPIVYLGEEPD